MDDNVSITLQLTDMFFRSNQRIAETTKDMLKSLIHFWDREHRDPDKTDLNRQFKNGAVPEYCFCESETDQEELHKRFTKDGISHCKVTLDGKRAILFSSWDHGLAQESIGIYRMGHAQETIVSQFTLNHASPDQCTLKNRDEAETMLICRYCRKNGIKINILDAEKDGVHDIQFPRRDKEKMDYIKTCVSFDLAGESGKELKRYLEYRNQSFMEAQKKALTLEGEERIYIVGKDGCVLECTPESFVSHGNYLEIDRRDKKDKDYVLFLADELSKMDCPVMLTEKDMEEYRQSSDKNEYLKKKDKEQGFPDLTADAYKAYKEKQAVWAAYETQISSRVEGLSKYDSFKEDRALAESCQNYTYVPDESDIKPDPELMKVIKTQNKEIVGHEPEGSTPDEILDMILNHEYDPRFDVSSTPEAQQSFRVRKDVLEAEQIKNELDLDLTDQTDDIWEPGFDGE